MFNNSSATCPCPTSTSCFSIVPNSNTLWVSSTGGQSTFITNSVICPTPISQQQQVLPAYIEVIPDHIQLSVGKGRRISFPDGTEIWFKVDGSFEIEDKNAKVIYKAARCLDFNPFINASDKLEEFIKFCGEVGVRQGDMLGIPIRSFVQWLVIEAAKADGEEASALLALPKPDIGMPRCRTCKRFISPLLKADGIEFCRPICLETKLKSHRRENHGYKASSKITIQQGAAAS